MDFLEAKFLALAEVLLEEDFAKFQSLRVLLIAEPERFREAGHDDTFNLTEEALAPDPEHPLYSSLALFLGFAQKYRYSFWLDWTGEENEGDFELWVAARVHALGKGSMDLTFVDDWQETIDFGQIERGDFIRDKFTLMGQHLVPIELDLIFLDTGEDAYHPFVVRRADLVRFPQFSEADAGPLGVGRFRIQRWDDPSL